jgi:hypothetical protein
MCDALHLNSIKQTPTPLNTLYFSEFNMNLIQRAIRQKFKDETGVSIDYQNKDDIFSIMRVVFINNAGNHTEAINSQVKFMNSLVIKTALGQIRSGVAQYMGYVRDIDSIALPPEPPVNTSTYGNKIPINNKIGV